MNSWMLRKALVKSDCSTAPPAALDGTPYRATILAVGHRPAALAEWLQAEHEVSACEPGRVVQSCATLAPDLVLIDGTERVAIRKLAEDARTQWAKLVVVSDDPDEPVGGAVAIVEPPVSEEVARAQLRSILQRLDPRRGLAALELQTSAGLSELLTPRPTPKRVLSTGVRAFIGSTVPDARPRSLEGTRILVLGLEPRATDPVVRALRKAGALVEGATLETLDEDAARPLDPSVLLVDPLVLDRPYDFSIRARHPRLRWASLLVAKHGQLASEASARAVLSQALPYLLYADRRISTALLRQRSIATRVEILGPARLLRAASEGAVIEVYAKRARALIRLVNGHIAAAQFVTPERGETYEDALAVGALLSIGSGRARIRPLADDEKRPGLALPLDTALADSFLGTLRMMSATVAPPPLRAAVRVSRSLPEAHDVTPGVSIFRGRAGSLRRGEDSTGRTWLFEELRRDASRVDVDAMWQTVARLERLEDEVGTSGLAFPTHMRPDCRSVGRPLEVSGSLHDMITLGWRMEHRFAVLEQITTAIEQLHGAGLVHGALCPDTILLDRDLAPWIGCASFALPIGTKVGPTVAEGARFAAPEVREGGELTPTSDVYSLGRLLQFLVDADFSDDDLDAAESGTAPSPEVLRIVRKATTPFPASRFRSVEAFAAALARMRPAIAGRASRRRVFTQRLRRHR